MPQAPKSNVDDVIRNQLGVSAPRPAQPQAAPQNAPQQAEQAPEQPNQDVLGLLQAQISGLTDQLKVLADANQGQTNTIRALEGELFSLRGKKEEEAYQLPSKEEIDELPRAEAISCVAKALIGKEIIWCFDDFLEGSFE